MSNSQAGIKEG